MDRIVTMVRLTKGDLQNMRIDDCPRCKHLTLQAKVESDIWFTCLTCGGLISLERIVSENIKH